MARGGAQVYRIGFMVRGVEDSTEGGNIEMKLAVYNLTIGRGAYVKEGIWWLGRDGGGRLIVGALVCRIGFMVRGVEDSSRGGNVKNEACD